MNRLEELLLLWQDQTITEPQLSELKQLLASPESRATLAQDFFMTGVILDALSMQRVAGETASPQPATPSRIVPPSHRQRWLIVVAAAVLVAVGAYLWYRPHPAPNQTADFAAVEQVQGKTFVVTGQQRLPAQAGQVLTPGQGIATGDGDSGAVVKMVDDVRHYKLTLGSETTVSTSAETEEQRGGASKLVLEQGDLFLEVTNSLGKKKMTVVTPMGTVTTETEKTALHLSDAAGVVVIRGEVDFVHKGTGKSIRLQAGQYVASTADGELYAPRLYSPEADVWGKFPPGYTESIAVAISPNGQMLASVLHENFEGAGLRLGPLDGREPPWALPGARCVAFSPDSQFLAVGDGRDVLFYEAATGKQERVLKGKYPAPQVRRVAFAPDGKTLAIGRGDAHQPGDVELWDLTTDSIRASWRAHAAGVAALAFSPDGRLLASGSHDKTVLIWDVPTNQERSRILMLPPQTVRDLAFAPRDGKTLAIACGAADPRVREPGQVKLWDVASETIRATLHGHTRVVTSVVYSPNGQTLVTGSADTTVRFWDAADGREYGMFVKGHKAAIGFEGLTVALSPDGKRLATASFDRTIKLWRTTKEEALPSSRAQAGPAQRRLAWDVRLISGVCMVQQ
jgi:WD40 repeat protein